MRVKICTTALITLTFVILFSCENIKEDPSINAEDFYGDGSFFIALAKLNTPNVNEDYCTSPQVYELRIKRNLNALGTVTIYSDKQFLNFKFDISQEQINEGWLIDRSFVWVGKEEDWIYGRDGYSSSWGGMEGINVFFYDPFKTSALQQILLEDWMLENCLIIATRITARLPDMTGESADGLINHSDYLTYSWNELYCIERCIDPGTLSVSYWESNPNIWAQGVTIGGIYYSKELSLQILKEISDNDNDVSNYLFEQLVSAKLNVDLGNTSYCIVEAIEAADTWMEENGPVGSEILSGNPAWDTGNSLANQLKNYNNGFMCADPAN